MFFAKKQLKKLARGSWQALPKRSRHAAISAFIQTITDEEKFRAGIPSMRGLLQNVRASGWDPRSIVDVGANVGDWCRMVAQIFPSTAILMVEGNPGCENRLRQTVAAVGERALYAIALLGPEERKSAAFYRPKSALMHGSSVLRELTTFPQDELTLPMRTLDSIATVDKVSGPLLLKLDVQGYELEVLRGAERLLQITEVAIFEASLIQYNEGSPLIDEIIAFMAERGFVVFDFCGQARRETDHALFQTDIAFVRRESPLRARKKFWLGEP